MVNYKIILGIAAIGIGFIGYVPYVRDVLARKTTPHTFSWVAWGVLEATAFFAQISKGGGPGTWVTGVSALVAVFIAGIAIKRGDTEIKLVDWIAFGGSLVGIMLWRATHNPLLAVIFVTVADALAFVPTFRKSYQKPEQETLTEYALSSLKFLVALFALGSFNVTTALYPFSLIISNGSFVIVSLIRRKILKKQIATTV